MDELQEEMKKNFLRVEVYFQHFNFERISESQAYNLQALMADFGGNIGLWIGWSALTACEILVFLFNLARGLFKK